jgi:lysophospholipase L1-like esterase
LEAYPSKKLTLDFSQASQVLAASSPKPPTDILNTLAYWRTTVDYQATFTQGKHYKICLFGDSISSPLGNSLGEQTFNFSLGGMSTISLLAQLQYLSSTDLKCQTAILEIGTNDSWYTIEDIEFSQKLSQVIELLRSHGTQQIVLLPAFYSTLAASQNRNLAGSIERVEHINRLLSQVASIKGVPIANTELQPLFEGKVLKQNLTLDGVHLNAEGLEIYRASLLKIIGSLQKHKT